MAFIPRYTNGVLEKFARLESVVVRVGKIAPPIAATLRAAGVEIEVKRGA